MIAFHCQWFSVTLFITKIPLGHFCFVNFIFSFCVHIFTCIYVHVFVCVHTCVRSVSGEMDVRWFLLCLHLVCLALGMQRCSVTHDFFLYRYWESEPRSLSLGHRKFTIGGISLSYTSALKFLCFSFSVVIIYIFTFLYWFFLGHSS